jgi:integrase
MLSPRLLKAMRAWWKVEQPKVWLFPGSQPDRHMDVRLLQLVCGQAAELAGIAKRVRVHTLRHYAELRTMPSRSGALQQQPGMTGGCQSASG